MKCLCCGKTIAGTDAAGAAGATGAGGWHRACIRRFFGTDRLPVMDISEENLMRIAVETTQKGLTVPGVQKKMSLHLDYGDTPRLTLVNYPTGYILKPQDDRYPSLPEAEYLVMQMARATGIRTVPFALVQIPDGERIHRGYITKRIDRILPRRADDPVQLLAMEDFCQLDLRLTADKYKGSYERCAGVITRYSVQPGLDLSEMFLRLVFSFVSGNSDMHLKNFSLIETAPGSGSYTLSDAYDLLPVNLILPEDTEQFALTMNGKKRGLRRNDFIAFAQTIGFPANAAKKLLDHVIGKEDMYASMITGSLLPAAMKEDFLRLLHDRMLQLRPGHAG